MASHGRFLSRPLLRAATYGLEPRFRTFSYSASKVQSTPEPLAIRHRGSIAHTSTFVPTAAIPPSNLVEPEGLRFPASTTLVIPSGLPAASGASTLQGPRHWAAVGPDRDD